MALNPEKNKFEMLNVPVDIPEGGLEPGRIELLRPDGSPVPKHWAIFTVGEEVIIKGYTFRVVYMNESAITLEPVGIPIIDPEKEKKADAIAEKMGLRDPAK